MVVPITKKLFLKRYTALFCLFFLLSVWLTGCAGRQKEAADTLGGADAGAGISDSEQSIEDIMPTTEKAVDFPGSYTVPDGWIKADQYSTEDKIFYVEEGHEEDEFPDNISIETGSNQYSADEHEKFRDAIVQQLMMQLQDVSAELTGDGTYTEQNYVVYIFTISEEDVVTKQYYIVGDKRYCLVHLTNFTGSESADEAAQAMADSFVWE